MRIGHLRELARFYSIQTTYEDAAGKQRKASRESLLAALEMRIPDGAKLDEALAARKERFWTSVVDPVTVVWGRRTPQIGLRLPRERQDELLDWTLELEDGSRREGRIDLRVFPVAWTEGGFIGKTIALQEKLPAGYHQLRLAGRETLLIVAPVTAHPPQKRSWGIFAPLYAVQTERSWGAGDLSDLIAYRQWVNELGGDIVATLPMLAAFEDEPSPYSPVSRLFWNEMYLDVTKLPEFDSADVDPYVLDALSSARKVDYKNVMSEKRRVLEKMAQRFTPDGDFHQFAMKGAYGYAHFRAAKEEKDSAAYHLYVQYRMAQQMREAGGLYLDFPLGVNPDGFDAWKYADIFAKGAAVGAPPDLFFTKGQNWGFPPLDPDAIRERRHEYFRACIRHHVMHADVLRIDHVMGLHRLFWIPEGAEAKDGVYIRYPEDELYAILLIESRRHRCAIVGEDLGTVPQYVPRMMARHGLRRMYVVQYELTPDALPEPAAESIASANTHDMPTFAAFWEGKDIDDRLSRGLLDGKGAREEHARRETMRDTLRKTLTARGLLDEDVLKCVLEHLAGSSAEMVLVNLEDLWGETQPQNVPGVPEQSWRNKFRYTLEEMRQRPEIVETLRSVDRRRRGSDGSET